MNSSYIIIGVVVSIIIIAVIIYILLSKKKNNNKSTSNYTISKNYDTSSNIIIKLKQFKGPINKAVDTNNKTLLVNTVKQLVPYIKDNIGSIISIGTK